jgi:hypothetical protein
MMKLYQLGVKEAFASLKNGPAGLAGVEVRHEPALLEQPKCV